MQWEPSEERERARIGDQAEMWARQVISTYGEGVLLRGPLVPDIDESGSITGYRESDFLVYTQGTVFCVEVKYYIGAVTYLPRYVQEYVWDGYGYSTRNVFTGYDTSKILQVKQGKRGDQVQRIYSNPLKKTKSFILLLKKYVGRIEPRFQRLFIIPVVCFANQADIRAIYDFKEGIIQIEHLPAFFQHHRNDRFAFQPTPWIVETILSKIPNWDRVLMTDREWVNGILVEPYLTYMGKDGKLYSLPPYKAIKMLEWQRPPGVTYAEMIVTFINGVVQMYPCRGGQLSLIRGEQPETFAIHQLQQLVVGVANKLIP